MAAPRPIAGDTYGVVARYSASVYGYGPRDHRGLASRGLRAFIAASMPAQFLPVVVATDRQIARAAGGGRRARALARGRRTPRRGRDRRGAAVVTPRRVRHHRHRYGHRARHHARRELDQPAQRHLRCGRGDGLPDRGLPQPDRRGGALRSTSRRASRPCSGVAGRAAINSAWSPRWKRSTTAACMSRPFDPTRVGVLLGACTADLIRNERYLETMVTAASSTRDRPTSGITFRARRSTSSPPQFGFEGLRSCIVAACASSTMAIGSAARRDPRRPRSTPRLPAAPTRWRG